MPSTYSNIKIQLMATGENNTTWGNVTNINLGTAIEEAIVGSADVTFASANVTLTLTDTNASQTARHMRLRCTGVTGGSTRNLVVPAIEKPYIVQNDCSDSILVKTAAGNGITVPAGKTMWVYSDGANVVNTTTHLSSLTLGTDLAVADGGTGASTFTANGVLLGNGTSAIQATAVGATGQVLVGNTGAAPSWAALSGIGVTSLSFGSTGLTPATATTGAITVAGTLGVANGGTGTATAFTAGSVVFAGASGVYSQDNANFFWDDTNNRLGIGTAAPGYKLDVVGGNGDGLQYRTSTRTIGIGQVSSEPTLFWGSGTPLTFFSGSELMRITSAGNVGIGVVPPAHGPSERSLDIGNTTSFGRQSDAALVVNFNTFLNSSAQYIYRISSFASSYQQLAGEHRFYTAPSGTAGSVATLTQRMTLDVNGNLGVGTASPGAKLDVRGSLSVVGSSGVAASYIVGAISGLSNGYEIIQSGANALTYNWRKGDNTIAMTLDSIGNLLLKASSDGTNGIIRIQNTAGTTTVQSYADNNDGWLGTVEAKRMSFITGNTRRMCIDSSGNVGIGTDAPSVRLEVNSGASPGAAIFNSTDNTYIQLQNSGTNGLYLQSAVSAAYLWNQLNTPLLFGTNNTERVRVTGDGNVGIGTTTPGAKLDVNGNAGIIVRDTSATSSQVNIGIGLLTAGRPFVGTNDNTNPLEVGTRAAMATVFVTNSAERMRITDAGDVGIGTQTPQRKLGIGGTANAYMSFNPTSFRQFTVGSDSNGFIIFDDNAAFYRQVIDASGNVGFNLNAPSYPMEVRANAASSASYIGITNTTATGSSGAAGYLARAGSNFAYFYVRGDGTAYIDNATANPLGFAVSGFEAMRITATGEVGIGTSSPNGKLTVAGAITAYTTGVTDQFIVSPQTTGSGVLLLAVNDANNAYRDMIIGGATNIFQISGTERARIDSSGNLLVGASSIPTTTGWTAQMYNGGSYTRTAHNTNAVSGDAFSQFYYNSASIGSIDQNGTTGVLYTTASDGRLKHDIIDAPEASSLIDAIQVRSFKWNADNSEQRYGMIAQELQEVVPEAVNQPADPDEMMGVDYSKLVPMLVKEIQSLRARVAQLEERK